MMTANVHDNLYLVYTSYMANNLKKKILIAKRNAQQMLIGVSDRGPNKLNVVGLNKI